MKKFVRSKRVSLLFGWIAFVSWGHSQQMPMFGNFNIAQLYYNPAYAGAGEAFRGTALNRVQWRGIEGAPKSTALCLDAPIGKGIGAGITFSNDQIGIVTENAVTLNGSYRVYLNSSTFVQMGLRLATSFFKVGSLDAFQWDDGDPVKENATTTVPRIGFGGFIHHPKFYAGISAPDIFSFDTKKVFYNPETDKSSLRNNYFLIAGSEFDISEFIVLLPSFIVRYYPERPLGITTNIGVQLNQTIVAGVTYTHPKVYGAYGMVSLSPKTRFGYRHEFSTSSLTITGQYGTGEFVITYGF